jgi:malate dehydrogenase (oxaloacetate-decarboxylating)
MAKVDYTLSNMDSLFPSNFTEEQKAKGKTVMLKKLSELAHLFYNGKMMTVPKAGVYGFNWFNVWYTPGVSAVSTAIRDDHSKSFDMASRGNLVAVVSDSTRVLGDGNCSPSGGLGVMEGKAMLMKYLGGIDAIALCMDSRDKNGKPDANKIIDFVKMLQPSFGAVNLEDIQQPECYKVLDTLRDECEIPVWHDDAQGTGSVTVAGLINAVKLAGKKMGDCKMVFWGAGASNTTIARLIHLAGGDYKKMIIFDSKGALHSGREDVKKDPRFYRKWELCEATNPNKVTDIMEACKGADALIALSTPGPDVVKPEWIKVMGTKPIVFACANPVPEIYPYKAKEAGAFIVATGRGDFPNQVNNSVGFPGILKGTLLVRASKVTDNMAVVAAKSVAAYAERRGINPENIIANMDEADVFPHEAADVAMQAIEDGVARVKLSRQEVYERAKRDIEESRKLFNHLMEANYVKRPPESMITEALEFAIKTVK